MSDRKADKIVGLLAAHKAEIIENLGASAFDVLSPKETAAIVGVDRLSDLIREGWLEPIPGKDIGQAHLYYRWRAVFVRQYRKTRKKEPS